jgi:hypothetical protein
MELFSKESRSTLRHTEPPVQWVLAVRSFALSGRDVNLTTRLHLVPRLKMSVAVPLYPNMPLWSAYGQLYLHFHLYKNSHKNIY